MSRFEKSILGAFFVFILIFFLLPIETVNVPNDEDDWRQWIEKKGGKTSYEDFALSVEGLREEEQHTRVHIFGGALYEEEGINAVGVCDSRFFYGCFHEFIGRATSDLGISAASDLNEICRTTFSGSEKDACQHGIGHGVQVFYGYTPKDIGTSLGVCNELGDNNILGGGCFGGIFMEYNLRTMLSDDGVVRDSDNIYSPCDELSDVFVPACLYWQPQWWRVGPFLGFDVQAIYEKMGDACIQTEEVFSKGKYDVKPRRICFEGIGGIIAPDTQFNTRRIEFLCDSSSDDEVDRLVCKSSAAYRTLDSPNPDSSQELCKGFTGAFLDYCNAYASANFVHINEISSNLSI